LADRLSLRRADVIADCVFLNMRRQPVSISRELDIPLGTVERIATAAQPLLRQSRRVAKECHYCGTTRGPFHRDHVFPRSRGGSDEPENIVIACQSCNSAKGDRTPEEWLS
jgi:5-methylcytosine-specific restriction endonuclease McrA